MSRLDEQLAVCVKYGSAFVIAPADTKVGIAKNVEEGLVPINGLRHPETEGTSGWYIWAGEGMSEAEDFFQPMHVAHLNEYCPQVIKYLGLAPGWRFLIAGDYEDVWFDTELLKV